MTFIISCFIFVLAVSVKGSLIRKSADFGYNFTLPCAGNTTKDIIWLKRQQVQEQLYPNINIFNNGTLQVVEAQENNSGEYLCKTFNSTELVSLLITKIGQNYTLQCLASSTKEITWFKQTRITADNPRVRIWNNGSLYVDNVTRNDYGEYHCQKANVVESSILESIVVTIKTPPPPLNVTIKPSTILALVLWNITGDGGYPIINFTAEFRLGVPDGEWIPISPNHITPNSPVNYWFIACITPLGKYTFTRQLEVYSLKPNTTYEFKIWATNQLGRSPVVNVFGTTQGSYKEEDLLRHLFREVDEFNSSSFDINLGSWTGIWSAAVGVFAITFFLLCCGTIILSCQEWLIRTVQTRFCCKCGEVDSRTKSGRGVCWCREGLAIRQKSGEEDILPNIILNPNFEKDQQTWKSKSAPDETVDCNDLSRLNNSWAMENANKK